MLCPKPSYLSAIFFRELKREFSIWNFCCTSLCSLSRFSFLLSSSAMFCLISWFVVFNLAIFSETSSRTAFSLSIVSLNTAASDLFLITLCVNSAFLILFCSRSVFNLFSSAFIPEASFNASIMLLRHWSISFWPAAIFSESSFNFISFSSFAFSAFTISSLFFLSCVL